ncbi:PREDICTED: zinc finger protein 692-like, partial [Mesitornis unicolor]|uniref:zinc finger protein 692-like n=1 Tax=Mesitornis unicolor TaxID=54374 RepID=UPI0005289005
FSSHGCAWSPGEPLHPEALQRLVVLTHGHGQECGFVPDVKTPVPHGSSQLVWECVAGHSFSWGVPGTPKMGPPQPPHQHEGDDVGCGSPPVARRRRSATKGGGEARSPEGDGDQGGEEGGDDGGGGT